MRKRDQAELGYGRENWGAEMSWDVNAKEFESVIALPRRKLYGYFVKRCAEHEEVWALRDQEGWVTSAQDDGSPMLPVWPHPTYARACATDAWAGAEPEAIALDEWLDDWLPGMEEDGLNVSVFPISPSLVSISVPHADLRRDLEAERDLYE